MWAGHHGLILLLAAMGLRRSRSRLGAISKRQQFACLCCWQGAGCRGYGRTPGSAAGCQGWGVVAAGSGGFGFWLDAGGSCCGCCWASRITRLRQQSQLGAGRAGSIGRNSGAPGRRGDQLPCWSSEARQKRCGQGRRTAERKRLWRTGAELTLQVSPRSLQETQRKRLPLCRS